MELLRIIKRTKPNKEVVYIVQKLCPIGCIFKTNEWIDRDFQHRTYWDKDIENFWTYGKVEFPTYESAKEHMYYFDGSKPVDEEIIKG